MARVSMAAARVATTIYTNEVACEWWARANLMWERKATARVAFLSFTMKIHGPCISPNQKLDNHEPGRYTC